MLIFNHGFASNTDINDEFLPHLARAGHEAIIFDQRGCGRTSPGSLYALTNEEYVLSDLDTLIETIVESEAASGAAPVPFFLWGHSMGGGIALNYAIVGTYRERFAGYLAFAPLITLHPKSRPGVPLRALLAFAATVYPTYRQAAGLHIEYVTHDPRWQAFFERDARERAVFSARQMYDMFARGALLMDAAHVERFVPRPVAVFHSNTDYINDVEGSREFLRLLPESVPRSKLYEYTDMAHSITHETPDRIFRVFTDLCEFIDTVLADGPQSGTEQAEA